MKQLTAILGLVALLTSSATAAGPTNSPATDVEAAAESGDGIMSEYVRMAASFAAETEEEKDIFIHTCRHVRGETLARLLEGFLSPGGTVANSDEADIVVVSDTVANMATLRQVAEAIDQPVPQVLVEARVVELTLDDDFEKEVNLAFTKLPVEASSFIRDLTATIATPGANPNTTQGSLINLQPWSRTRGEEQQLLAVFLRYLETRGKARILSAPNLTLMRGAEGSIVTGEEVPILTQTVTSGSISTSTEFKSVGIKLRVRPLMIAGRTVRLEISPEVSTVTGFSDAGEGLSNPIIAVRNAKSVLEVHDGQLASIGGLLRSEERRVVRRVPGLGALPILGHLFRGSRIEEVETQLVIFLTVRIVDGPPGIVRPGEVPQEIRDEIERMDRGMGEPNAER